MFSRRRFLCVASSASVAWTAAVKAENQQDEKKADPFLSREAQNAIRSGLKYLKDQQHKDGSFGTAGFKGSVGITSLCGLAMLSGGHQPGAGVFGPTLDWAIDFVLGKEDRRKPGYLVNTAASPHGPMYNHGYAVMFLAAADGKISDKKRAKKAREVLGRAVALTLASQNAEKGWRYTPESKDSDLTATAVQVCALRLARDAGIGVPKAALMGAAGYVKKCHERTTGGFRYMIRGGTAGWARTGAALLALYSAGVTRGREVERGLAYLLKNRPNPKAAKPDMHYFYGHYNAALATWAAGGETRKKWYGPARDELIARQGDDGNWNDTICAHYATAAALIALQAPNGHLSPEF
jgi:hypothetical protein